VLRRWRGVGCREAPVPDLLVRRIASSGIRQQGRAHVSPLPLGTGSAASARKRTKLKTKLRGLSPQANYTDRATAAVGEVVPTFAGRGCYVVSATDSHGR
jgi:hypothetical protein